MSSYGRGRDPDDCTDRTLHFFGDQTRSEARYATHTHDLYSDPVLPDAGRTRTCSQTGASTPAGRLARGLTASVQPYGFSLHVGQTGATLYSEYGRNEEERVQMLMLAAPDSYLPGTYLLAWEDRLNSDLQADWDYQDLVIMVRPIVPEPASIVHGVAALSLRGLRKLV